MTASYDGTASRCCEHWKGAVLFADVSKGVKAGKPKPEQVLSALTLKADLIADRPEVGLVYGGVAAPVPKIP